MHVWKVKFIVDTDNNYLAIFVISKINNKYSIFFLQTI